MDTCHILGIAAWPPTYLEIGWWKYWNRDWNWGDDGKEPVSHYNYPRHGLWHDRHDPQVEVQDLFILIPSYWPTPEYHLLTTSPGSSRTVTLTWRSVALDTCVTLFTTQPGMPVYGTWHLLPTFPRKETKRGWILHCRTYSCCKKLVCLLFTLKRSRQPYSSFATQLGLVGLHRNSFLCFIIPFLNDLFSPPPFIFGVGFY